MKKQLLAVRLGGLSLCLGLGFALVGCGGAQSADESVEANVAAAFSPSVLNNTKTWKVIATSLNCRVSAGTASPVVFDLKKGSIVDVIPGAARPVANGFTWIQVNPRGDIDHNTCFVAADDRFLTAATKEVADNFLATDLFEAKSLKVKTALNCREFPSATSAIIFSAMPAGTVLDVSAETGSELPFVHWNGDAYWVHVNPRGDTDHNTCWVSAKKANVTLSKTLLP
jgi:hypothetical protein